MSTLEHNTDFDVLIIGAGLAGLTLALQLKERMPNLRIAAIDRTNRPLPEAAYKVGESTVPFGSTYLTNVLKLKEYLKETQVQKMGLRFFTGNQKNYFENRSEVGLSVFESSLTPISDWQIDRGKLENDLREIIISKGITLIEGKLVADITCDISKNTPSKIKLTEKNQEDNFLITNWLVDASGRRRLLARKFKLTKNFDWPQRSSAWFRIDKRIDVSNFVSSDNSHWQNRVSTEVKGARFHSTNHLIGEGYWVWLIPLQNNRTSIGIVASEKHHKNTNFNTFEKSMSWLKEHEPVVAKAIKDETIMDFKFLGNYSHTSEQLYSSRGRWALTGEAGSFPDPFYSPGTNGIALGNSYISELIELDLIHKKDENFKDKICNMLNEEYFGWLNNALIHSTIQYDYHHNSIAFGLKHTVNTMAALASAIPLNIKRNFQQNFTMSDELLNAEENVNYQLINKVICKLRTNIDQWALNPNNTFDTLEFPFLDIKKIPQWEDLAKKAFDLNMDLDTFWKESLKVVQSMALCFYEVLNHYGHSCDDIDLPPKDSLDYYDSYNEYFHLLFIENINTKNSF